MLFRHQNDYRLSHFIPHSSFICFLSPSILSLVPNVVHAFSSSERLQIESFHPTFFIHLFTDDFLTCPRRSPRWGFKCGPCLPSSSPSHNLVWPVPTKGDLIKSPGPIRAAGKEVRDNHCVLHLTASLPLTRTVHSCKIQAWFWNQSHLYCVYVLTVTSIFKKW